jgi:hypothetical protein
VFPLFFISCGKKDASFEIVSFHPFNNKEFQAGSRLVEMQADLTDATFNGIIVPTARQCAGGQFAFDFTLKNTGDKKERLFYKIYYQNETYKMDDAGSQGNENFYGSWEDNNTGFKIIEPFDGTITISDSFRIVGNPRDEGLYYGTTPERIIKEKEGLVNRINYIRDNAEWFGKIKAKAEEKRIDPEKQLYLDATWAMEQDILADKSSNNRWKRNPRMGEYKAMLVVVNEEQLREIPYEVKSLNMTGPDNQLVNPFGYFEKNREKGLDGKRVLTGERRVKLKAQMDLGAGIFIGESESTKQHFSKDFYNSNCGEQEKLMRKAHFMQYFHYINKDFPLNNIPEVADVDAAFSRLEYNRLKRQHDTDKQFVTTYVNSSDCPCKTVISDSVKKEITLINPGNKEGTQLKKEHVGIIGRIGLTYGKWRAKIKFPPLINRYNVWNGLTNAFWLLSQSTDTDWNQRRPCNSEFAYIPKWEGENKDALYRSRKQVGYSEIDFEILKESQYWPVTSYKDRKNYPKENTWLSDDITVTCTNWDMACHEPALFHIGAEKHTIDGMDFVHHRWNPWYKALTTKTAAKNTELFGGDYYYFEIEWLPTKIIWKIGPEKDKMRIVCIMDNTVSAIPNNQMVATITQEWHNQEWWPVAPFKQNYIPFPKSDIIGKVLEIEIE